MFKTQNQTAVNGQNPNATSVQVFNNTKFGEIRVVEIEGKTYFVGNDVAKSLGYLRPKDAISAHCKGAAFHRLPDNQGVMQDTKIIPEGDVYRLAAKSELPGAEEFESWIFDEVLPSIRKNGGYLAAIADDTPDVIMARALVIAQDTITRVNAEKQRLLLTANEQAKQLKEAAPKVQYYDDTLSSKSKLTVNSIALCLGISHIKLNKLLCQWNIQYRQGDVYFLHAKYRNLGLAKHHPFPYVDSNGVNQTRQHLYWNEAGKKFILDMYARQLPAANDCLTLKTA